MQLLHTSGLLALVIISLISMSSLQAMVWSGPGCSTRDHRGCCFNWLNPRRLRPPCAPTMQKESE